MHASPPSTVPGTQSIADSGSPSRRFLAVHFPHWLIDLELGLLQRALSQIDAARQAQAVKDLASRGAVAADPATNAMRAATRTATRAAAAFPWPTVVVADGSRMGRFDASAKGVAAVPLVHVAALQILACSDLAVSHGIRIGMTAGQAESMCPPVSGDGASSQEIPRIHALLEALRDRHSDARCHGVRALGGRSWPDRIVSFSDRLLVIQWDPALAMRAIVRLARCIERLIPVVSVEPAGQCAWHEGRLVTSTTPDTVLGDFTGCAQLFRGQHRSEQGLMQRISSSLGRRGFRCQVATASTVGAASAVARCMQRLTGYAEHGAHHAVATQPRCIAVARGRELEFLDPLPVESLRISEHAATALRSVEVESVGQLAQLRREGVAARLSGGAHMGSSSDDGNAHPAKRGAKSRSANRGTGTGSPRGPTRSRHAAASGAWHAGTQHAGTQHVQPSLFSGHSAEATVDATAENSQPRFGSSSGLRGQRTLRSADDALLRLDQALGLDRLSDPTASGEQLLPLRSSAPLVLVRDFDGPCSRLETVVIACGELIDALVKALGRRREGLRSATWIFHHASLPADLSTDASIGVASGSRGGGREPGRTGSSSRHEGRVELSPRCEARVALPSRLVLDCTRPSSRRAHLWSVFRPRLEKLALDHGVERIECRVEQTALLRFRQAALLRSGEMGHGGASGPRALHGAPSRRAIHHGNGRAEWRDLVVAKFGASILRDMHVPRAAHALRATHDRGGAHGCVDPSGCVGPHRPTQWLRAPEEAMLFGGAYAESIARSIATRTRWDAPPPAVRPHGPPHHRVEHVAPFDPAASRFGACRIDMSSSSSAHLLWRGVHWPMRAIDGWEREAAMWLEDAAAVQPVVSRVQVGAGLWIFVRWPPSLPRPRARVTDWITDSTASIGGGVALAVQGVWS